MTKLINTFSGGTDGATITAPGSNVGGSRFDIVEIGTGATVVYDATTLGGGDVAAKFTTGSTGAVARVGWNTSLGSPDVVYGVAYIYLPALPSANLRIAQFLSSANASRFQVFVTTAGQVQVSDSAGGQAGGNRTTASVAVGALTRIEWRVELNTAGVATIRLYKTSPLGTTPDETKVGVASNFGGTAAGYFFGIPSPVANIGPTYLSAVGLSDTDWLGNDLTAPNSPPTVSVFTPWTRYAWGDAATVVATVDDADLNATHTTAWTVIARPSDSTLTIGATTDIATFTPDRPGNYTVRATVTDNAGAAVTADQALTVVPAVYVKSGGVEVPARFIIGPPPTSGSYGSGVYGSGPYGS